MFSKTYTKPEEQELIHKEEYYRLLEEQLLEKELFLSTLQAEVRTFEYRYFQIAGQQIARIDSLKGRIAGIVSEFSDLVSETAKQSEEFWKYSNNSGEAFENASGENVFKPFIKNDDLKTLFRKVAKKIHPDLAVNEKERELRSELMKRANEAFATGNTEALNQILLEWENRSTKEDKNHLGTEVASLIRKIAQIEDRLRQITQQVTIIELSDIYILMKKSEQASAVGIDLVQAIANEVDQQIKLILLILQKIILETDEDNYQSGSKGNI